MRITSKGQVTIPQEVRERFGLLPDTEVDFVIKRNTVHLVKTKDRTRPTRGETIVRRLRGSATVKMTTDEILALTRK
jgi:AbrB family looped-hinge helix DNA binding protein